MRNRPSRGRLSAALLSGLALATLCLAMAMPAAASARLAVGISDAGYGFFSDPLFTRVHAPVARDSAPWNVAVTHNRTRLITIRNWLAWAKMAHVTPLISFGGYSNSDVPSTAQYKAAVKQFLKDFPTVRNYTAWNEPDWIYRSLSRKPAQAAAYFNTLQGLCRSCTVAAGDAYLPAANLAPWLKQYARYLRYRPKAWALHPYDDVRGHKTAQLRTLMHYTRGPIWLDEISGVEQRGHWHFPSKQSTAAAARDEKFLFSLPKRYHQITAIYHYQWQASAQQPWDSGLLDTRGRPRPAYTVWANAVRGKLP
jgi:putative glycosyl hydrolase